MPDKRIPDQKTDTQNKCIPDQKTDTQKNVLSPPSTMLSGGKYGSIVNLTAIPNVTGIMCSIL